MKTTKLFTIAAIMICSLFAGSSFAISPANPDGNGSPNMGGDDDIVITTKPGHDLDPTYTPLKGSILEKLDGSTFLFDSDHGVVILSFEMMPPRLPVGTKLCCAAYLCGVTKWNEEKTQVYKATKYYIQ